MSRDEAYRDRSVLIHGKFRSEKWDFQDHILPPITTAVSFRLRSAERGAEGFQQFANPDVDRSTAHPIYIYDRLDEPCVGLLEETLAFAEKGECAVCFGSGMSAVAASIGIHVRSGDHVVYHPAVYGCTYSHLTRWLSRFGVEATPARFSEAQALEAAVRPETRVVYFESPCNPTMELVDLEAVASFVRKVNADRPEDGKIVTVIDNTFASPYGQRPLTHGIDYVVHSLTKHISGFGATMGGVVVGPRKTETDLLLYRKDFGGSMTPDAAWHILTYGVPTLALRLERQQEAAQRVAEFLNLHPKVARVHYPGLDTFAQKELALRQMRDIDGEFAPGALIFFELKGSPEEAYNSAVKVCDHLASEALSVTLAVSLGQIRTLVEHPASMTHAAIPPEDQAKAGISPGGVRLSIGLEDVRDILRDIESALARA
ncbi:MAG: aminotransferase class I/II-fold pyridoxal phosphate-dependent enzyme [Fimbriimonadaceae bacterium]|nr:aminotransferase class I/II-fold pyridoxal phosphate-dependent enzyme [Fimbriimonadaceae bacterium]QYK55887.1 MAG: aminotransferase class I/II-fold pyridoxal phosphate-dependent enzyme [Fimbriimonadaceae bacterium]